MASTRSGDGLFMRAASVVGDLDSPFYGEERQRDVWNEASAVGFQLMLWLGLIAADVMIWVGGATGLPYAVATFAVVGVSSLVVLTYAGRVGVKADSPEHLRRGAFVPAVGLVLTFFLGVAASREWPEHGFWSGFYDGLFIGGGIAAVVGVGSLVRELLRSRQRRA